MKRWPLFDLCLTFDIFFTCMTNARSNLKKDTSIRIAECVPFHMALLNCSHFNLFVLSSKQKKKGMCPCSYARPAAGLVQWCLLIVEPAMVCPDDCGPYVMSRALYIWGKKKADGDDCICMPSQTVIIPCAFCCQIIILLPIDMMLLLLRAAAASVSQNG
jgi:hypothetical protein